MAFDIKDRPGVISEKTMRVYFERGINDTAALKANVPLDSTTRDGITEYANAETQAMWVGFALGRRCAERIAREFDGMTSRAAMRQALTALDNVRDLVLPTFQPTDSAHKEIAEAISGLKAALATPSPSNAALPKSNEGAKP